MGGRRWLNSSVASAITWLAPALAAAPVEWEAPQGCPDTRGLLVELQRALDTEVVELGAVSRVRGVVIAEPAEAASAPRYRLTLEVVDERRRSTRSFEAEQCADLARTAALAISLAVHESAERDEGLGGRASFAGAESAAAREPPEDALGASAADGEGVPPRWWWSAGPDAVLDVGALPDPALGVGLAGRAGVDAVELDLHALLLPSQQRPVGLGDAAEFGLMAAGLRACAHLFEGALVAGGCLGIEAGRFSASGVGLQPGREVHDVWLAAGAAALVRTAFEGPLQLELLAEPLVPLARKQYAVNETDVVHSPSVVNARFQLGLVIGGPRAAGRP